MPSGPSTSQQQQQQQQHHQQQQQIATIETRQNENIPIPIVTCDFASDVSTSEAADGEQNYDKDTLKVSAIVATHSSSSGGGGNSSNSGYGNTLSSINGKSSTSPLTGTGTPQLNELKVSPTSGRCRALSVGIDNDMVSEFDPSSSDSGIVSRCAVVKPLKFRLCQPIFGKKTSHHKNLDIKRQKDTEPAELEPAIPKIVKQRDPEKEKRRIARKKEKRATLILGLIMGSFIACWLPFFFLYILTPACKNCDIPDSAFAVAFWLGYMNSALNPAIYTIFNKDFRRAFRRILFK